MRLFPQFVALLLSACSILDSTQQSCTILDPDLAQGKYRGGCQHSLAEGYGEVSGTSSYQGDFMAGKKHGKGLKIMPNGDRYEGEFSNDYRDGHGTYVWGEQTPWAGDRYEGEYRQDLRHGWGVFQWNSGDRYEGPWEYDLRLGFSVMEQRQAQAAEAAARRIYVGAVVCAEEKWDAINYQQIRGKVENLAGKLATIRIVEVEGGMVNIMNAVLATGDLLTDEAGHWQQCEQSGLLHSR